MLFNYQHCLFPRDISKFAMHFIVEEIDEDTSMEELQKMMLVALVYRVLVCFYEVRLHSGHCFSYVALLSKHHIYIYIYIYIISVVLPMSLNSCYNTFSHIL